MRSMRILRRYWRHLICSLAIVGLTGTLVSCASKSENYVLLDREQDLPAGQAVVAYPEQHVALVVDPGTGADRLTAFRNVDLTSGCLVHWEPSRNLFAEPCGGSLWQRDGTPYAGPSAIPLQRLPVRVRDGLVEVGGL
jgi:hypothetical protein